MPKEKILITDDSEMNRAILADILEGKYEILEAEDGIQAVSILQKQSSTISLMLLDIVMPRMNGFEVLDVMNKNGWIDDVPVIMVSAETGSDQVQSAYSLGVTDFISRPFDVNIVRRRVNNTLLLYAKQKRLTAMVEQQIYEKEQRSSLMIDILSHIVEFRNGESGLHIVHVRKLTEIFCRKLRQITDKYDLTDEKIELIATASALHDIGKIAIDDKILNKPGRLTDEEFRIMKTHSEKGAQMLSQIPVRDESHLVDTAYEIARWHHERWDGRGYPDGKTGDDIPISAQIVALSDVYDALTSVRVYKGPYTHDEAVDMILDGQCGAFNPQLLQCLRENRNTLQAELNYEADAHPELREMRNYEAVVKRASAGGMSERTLRLLDYERMKYNFYEAMSEEVHFEYKCSPSMLTFSLYGAKKLGLDEIIMNPERNPAIQALLGENTWETLKEHLKQTTPEQPEYSGEYPLYLSGGMRQHKLIFRAVWSDDLVPKLEGALGKAVDDHAAWEEREELTQKAHQDPLTGLLNRAGAQEKIEQRLQDNPEHHLALAYFDLDFFKDANNTYGHLFGDKVLQELAHRMEHSIRGSDIAARIGGDEFVLFLDCMNAANIKPIVERIHRSLCGDYEGFNITVSMGVAESKVVGTDYETLLDAADQALYVSKQAGKATYTIYDPEMKSVLQGVHNTITPLDS